MAMKGYIYPKGTHWMQRMTTAERSAHAQKIALGRKRKRAAANKTPKTDLADGSITGNAVPAYLQGLAAKLAELGKADWASGYLAGYRDAKRGN